MTVDSFWEVNSFNLKKFIFGHTETCEVKPSLCEEDEKRRVNAIPANNITIKFHKLRDNGSFYANISWIPSPGEFIRISRICNVQFPNTGSYLRLIKEITWNSFTICCQTYKTWILKNSVSFNLIVQWPIAINLKTLLAKTNSIDISGVHGLWVLQLSTWSRDVRLVIYLQVLKFLFRYSCLCSALLCFPFKAGPANFTGYRLIYIMGRYWNYCCRDVNKVGLSQISCHCLVNPITSCDRWYAEAGPLYNFKSIMIRPIELHNSKHSFARGYFSWNEDQWPIRSWYQHLVSRLGGIQNIVFTAFFSSTGHSRLALLACFFVVFFFW